MSDDIEISDRITRLVWKRLGNKSVRQIAQETGLTPEQVLRIKNELLEGVDDLSIAQKKYKLIVELEGIAQDAREAAENSVEDFKSGMWNSAVSAMKTMLAELNRIEKADTSKVEALNAMRVRELVSLMYEVVDSGVPVIAAKYDLPQDELFDIFQDALTRAAARREALEA